MGNSTRLGKGDALLVVDVQNDFLPGGRLPVLDGDAVISPLNRCVHAFYTRRFPIFASRDWHPPDHCSFRTRGGPWPPHCVAGTAGAELAADLKLPAGVVIVSKAMTADREAYSAFEETGFAELLKAREVTRLFVGGLATDYCVLRSVRDALAGGWTVFLLTDAIRAVNAGPDDGRKAEQEMARLGARPLRTAEIAL